MKKIFLILILVLIPSAYADEYYSVKKPDGSVAVIYYKTGSMDTIQDVVQELGYNQPGYAVKPINESDIPRDKSDRENWAIMGKKIVIDTDKKQLAKDRKNLKQVEQGKVLEKLNINKQEAILLKEVADGK